jgi:hypothetical protein
MLAIRPNRDIATTCGFIPASSTFCVLLAWYQTSLLQDRQHGGLTALANRHSNSIALDA